MTLTPFHHVTLAVEFAVGVGRAVVNEVGAMLDEAALGDVAPTCGAAEHAHSHMASSAGRHIDAEVIALEV